jgi:hypothetical protein
MSSKLGKKCNFLELHHYLILYSIVTMISNNIYSKIATREDFECSREEGMMKVVRDRYANCTSLLLHNVCMYWNTILYPISIYDYVSIYYFLMVRLGLELRTLRCKAHSPMLEPHVQSIFLWLFWRWTLVNYFPGLANQHWNMWEHFCKTERQWLEQGKKQYISHQRHGIPKTKISIKTIQIRTSQV